MASGSSSSTDTSWPSASIDLAIAEPTRPQPTIRTNMSAALYKRAPARARPPSRGPSPSAGGAVRITLQGAFSTT